MIKYILDIKTPSLNEVINANRTHNKVGASFKKKLEEEICWLIKSQGVKHIKKPCKVHITFYEKDKRRDVDNIIAGGTKSCLDSLVKMKVLPDDNQQWVKQIIPIVKTSDDKKYKVIIELEEI